MLQLVGELLANVELLEKKYQTTFTLSSLYEAKGYQILMAMSLSLDWKLSEILDRQPSFPNGL